MHFDVVQVFTLAQIVVIRGGEETSTVAPHDRLQVSAMDVEGERLESVHPSPFRIQEEIFRSRRLTRGERSGEKISKQRERDRREEDR